MIDSTSPRALVSILLVVAVLAAGPFLGVAATDYTVSTSSETDTPTRTVEIEGSQYTISSVATAQVGGSITISVQVPDNTGYVLDIYNDDEQAIVDTRSGAGSQPESIDLSGVGPGTYAIALQVDGNVVAVKPLVVEGVSVSLDAPASVESDHSLTATVETGSIDGETTPQSVKVAVWNGDETIRVDATETGSGAYEATVDGLTTGDYQVSAAAHGSGTVMGEPTVIGVSTGTWVTVKDDNGSGPGGGDPGGGDSDDDDGGDNTSTDGEPTGDNNATISDDGDGEAPDNDSDEAPQSPTAPTAVDGDDAADSVPLVGPAALVIPLSVLTAASLTRRRE